MGSSRSSRHLREEGFRQALIEILVGKLGYPRELIAVEKELASFPHLTGALSLPQRRIDLVCFARNIHPDHLLFPLLLIECKVEESGFHAQQQALGYNHYLKAPYVAISTRKGPQLIFPQRTSFLPSFAELLAAL
jgi:hypothetical protein